MKVKEESEKVGLKLSIQKTKIMASIPITSWYIDGETVETVSDFIFLGSTITADGDCSHEIKRCLLFGRKAMTNLDSILKSRDITLPTKICLVKVMVFAVVMYGSESWTIKKAERQRIDAFELQCWRRLLRVPWRARRSIQYILKEISPEYSLEGLTLILKLQYFDHLMWRADSEKTLMLGKIEGRRWRGWQRMRWLSGITDSMDLSLSNSGRWWRTGKPGVPLSVQRVGHDWVTKQQQQQQQHVTIFTVTLYHIFCAWLCRNNDKYHTNDKYYSLSYWWSVWSVRETNIQFYLCTRNVDGGVHGATGGSGEHNVGSENPEWSGPGKSMDSPWRQREWPLGRWEAETLCIRELFAQSEGCEDELMWDEGDKAGSGCWRTLLARIRLDLICTFLKLRNPFPQDLKPFEVF